MANDPLSWIRSFRAMHERKKQGLLNGAEQKAYAELQEAFARAILAVQGLTHATGASARQTFRVAVMSRVELKHGGRVWKVVTIDLSLGGFSAVLDHTPDRQKKFEFELALRNKDDVISGIARAVGNRDDGSGARISFAFDALSDEHRARLEDFLYDSALSRLPT